jgi:hypothetical protein
LEEEYTNGKTGGLVLYYVVVTQAGSSVFFGGICRYKFIVDGEWRFSPEDATMSDDNGYINNYIDTTNFEPLIQGNKNNDMDDLSGTIHRKHSKEQ